MILIVSKCLIAIVLKYYLLCFVLSALVFCAFKVQNRYVIILALVVLSGCMMVHAAHHESVYKCVSSYQGDFEASWALIMQDV